MYSLVITAAVTVSPAVATLTGFENITGANDAIITTTPPNPVTQNPNDGILTTWDEKQNVTLTEDLLVDRVADESASYIEAVSGGFLIKAGTIVSSHYLQWDPGNGSSGTVAGSVVLDSEIFAFITADQKLFASDAIVGLDNLDYNDFGLRGLEGGDTTVFNGNKVDINWTASSPGDWTRLITAFSPAASPELTTNADPAQPATVDFGIVRIGTTNDADLTITNTGGIQPDGLTGQAPTPGAGEFTLLGDGTFTSLGSGASTTIGYRYAPTDHGADSEAIGQIDSNDSAGVADADAPVTLQGIGVGPVFDSSITPDTTIHVADVNLVSDESGMIDLIVSNTTLDDNGGNDDLTTLTLVDYMITGADADKFSLTTPLGAILKGDDLTLTIEFDPMSTAGDFDAVLTLFTDEDAPLGGDGNMYQWSLTGTSRVPAPAGIWISLIGLTGMMRRRGRV
ncbi:choice-of-anchor D domain-containing protein [Planctomycetales bacterium ZRK34]|nr:choice-of-anchor D domain-containing protein [Planctomycetales bacterium ZRK34]